MSPAPPQRALVTPDLPVQEFTFRPGQDVEITFTSSETLDGQALRLVLGDTPTGPATVTLTTGGGGIVTSGFAGSGVIPRATTLAQPAPKTMYGYVWRTDAGHTYPVARLLGHVAVGFDS
jgi:hypothetical protein